MEKISYTRYRFPPEIIDQAIWLYLRFTLSLRDVEDLLAERGVALSYETVRRLGASLRTDDRGRPRRYRWQAQAPGGLLLFRLAGGRHLKLGWVV
jgi:transposase-like protein